MLKKIHGIQLS
jgi:hypothetical protein